VAWKGAAHNQFTPEPGILVDWTRFPFRFLRERKKHLSFSVERRGRAESWRATEKETSLENDTPANAGPARWKSEKNPARGHARATEITAAHVRRMCLCLRQLFH
jgi:hypothetical protein